MPLQSLGNGAYARRLAGGGHIHHRGGKIDAAFSESACYCVLALHECIDPDNVAFSLAAVTVISSQPAPGMALTPRRYYVL